MIESKVSTISKKNKLRRLLWNIVYVIFFRPFPTKFFRRWRNLLLVIFGAKIKSKAGVYSSANIWAPWNLVLHENAWIGPNAICYNVDKIIIGKNATVSQNVHLCAASHDIYSKTHELITAPIIIENQAWIGADAFIAMGITIGQGAVIGARACVYRDVNPWDIVGGNPAKFIKKRIIKDA